MEKTKDMQDYKKFNPYDQVIVLANITMSKKTWIATYYSHYDEDIGKHVTIDGIWHNDDDICLYENNKNLIGKKI